MNSTHRLAARVALDTGIPLETVQDVIASFTDHLGRMLAQEHRVVIRKLGSFTAKVMRTRTEFGYSPPREEHVRVHFTQARDLRAKLRAGML